MDITDYLDRARAALGDDASDRELGRALGLKSAAISQFRTRRAFPSQETMVKLADLAGIDHQTALLDLVLSKATDPQVKNAWSSIRQHVAKAALALALIAASSIVRVPDTHAATTAGAPESIYYAIYVSARRARRWLAATHTFFRKSLYILRSALGAYREHVALRTGLITHLLQLQRFDPTAAPARLV